MQGGPRRGRSPITGPALPRAAQAAKTTEKRKPPYPQGTKAIVQRTSPVFFLCIIVIALSSFSAPPLILCYQKKTERLSTRNRANSLSKSRHSKTDVFFLTVEHSQECRLVAVTTPLAGTPIVRKNYIFPVTSTHCQGSPYLPRSSRKGSGSNCSIFHTPGLRHVPSATILEPIMAGTPVVYEMACEPTSA